jgi:hypothetical protein
LQEELDRIRVWDTSGGTSKLAWSNDKRRIQWHGWWSDSERIVYRDVDGLAVLSVSDSSIRRLPRTFARGHNDSVMSGNLLASASGGVVQFLDAEFRQRLLIVPELDTFQEAVFITPRGQYDITPGARLPRVVVLCEGEQHFMTVQEFTEQFGWINDPDAVAAWNQ